MRYLPSRQLAGQFLIQNVPHCQGDDGLATLAEEAVDLAVGVASVWAPVGQTVAPVLLGVPASLRKRGLVFSLEGLDHLASFLVAIWLLVGREFPALR